jgi:hypothetical protein
VILLEVTGGGKESSEGVGRLVGASDQFGVATSVERSDEQPHWFRKCRAEAGQQNLSAMTVEAVS